MPHGKQTISTIFLVFLATHAVTVLTRVHRMFFMLFLLLCSICSIFCFTRQITQDNLVGRFEFSQKDCLSEHFPSEIDSMMGSFDRIEEVAVDKSCLPSNGVGTYQLTSTANISTFRGLTKASNSLSIDMWMKIDDNLLDAVELFTIGSPSASSSSSFCDYNLQILYQASNISLRFCSLVGGIASYSYSDATTLPSFVNKSTIFHMVTSIEFYSETTTFYFTYQGMQMSTTTSYYVVANKFTFNGNINGTSFNSLLSFQSFLPATWDPSFNFNIFRSESTTSSHNDINLYQLLVYDKSLSEEAILTNYEAKLSDSLPVVVSSTLYINEDGMVGDHYDTPAYYLNDVPFDELSSIRLYLYDLDQSAISPNYGDSLSQGRDSVQLLSLPTKGILYDLSGNIITSVPHVISWDSNFNGYGMKYRPKRNEYSVSKYAQFTYRAQDVVTGLYSIYNATVQLIVQSVDDPPYFKTNFSTNAYIGKVVILSLSGSDDDNKIRGAWLDSTSLHGYLYDVAPNGTMLGLIESGNRSLSSLKIAYSSKSNETFYNSFITKDKFTFYLVDELGKRSVSKSYEINVYTGIVATASSYATSQLATEDSVSNITIYAEDVSGKSRDLFVTVGSGCSHGQLYESSKAYSLSDEVGVGVALARVISASEYTSGIMVKYMGNKNYFNYPSVMWNGSALPTSAYDSFSYYARTDNFIQSSVETQFISVQNVNDPTEITFAYPDNADRFIAYSSTPSGDDELFFTSSIVISGFTLVDVDLNVDIIKAEVLVNNGFVTLNQDYIHLLDFQSSKYCVAGRRWGCLGSGFTDDRMIFVGMPCDIENALNGLTYQTNLFSTKDVINVTLYDGVTGLCFDSSQLSSGSIHNGCLITSVVVAVEISSNSNGLIDLSSFPLVIRIAIISGVVVLLLVMCRILYYKVRADIKRSLKLGRCFMICCWFLIDPGIISSPKQCNMHQNNDSANVKENNVDADVSTLISRLKHKLTADQIEQLNQIQRTLQKKDTANSKSSKNTHMSKPWEKSNPLSRPVRKTATSHDQVMIDI